MPKKITRKAKMNQKTLAGSFIPSTVNEEERTVEVSFTTGEGGRRYDWYEGKEYIEELDVTENSVRTERLDKGLSVIDSHRSYDGIDGVFGVTENYRFENGELIGTVRFAKDELSDTRFQKVADGILRHVSLGYKVHKYFKSRGADDKLDTYRAVDWEPTELSFVPVSFETTNGVRAEQRDNEPTYEVLIEENAMPDEIKDNKAQRSAPQVPAVPAASQTAEPVQETRTVVVEPALDENAIRAQVRQEHQDIVAAADSAGLTREFADAAIEKGLTIDQFRASVIAELGNESSEHVIRNQGVSLDSDNRSDQNENTRNHIVEAIRYRDGATDVELTPEIRQYTGASLMDLARHYVGGNVQGGILGMSVNEIAKRAFHTTSDFPLILENVMNKNLQRAYTETPQTFRDLGRRTTMTDFREKHTYSLGDAPNLLPLGEHGEYKMGTFSEGKEKYALGTFARSIAFTRKMLINDDMSALSRMPSMWGAAGSRLESDIVWGLLLGWNFHKNQASATNLYDGNPLFDASRGNLLEAGSAFSEDALSAMRLAGRNMKTLDGNFMNVLYNQLVVPADLETAAEKQLYNNFVAANAQDTNPFLNKLRFRTEPRLAVVSTSAYYGFNTDGTADTFEYAYLAGEEEMATEIVNSMNVDGIHMNVRKDFGAGVNEWRGMIKATGAA